MSVTERERNVAGGTSEYTCIRARRVPGSEPSICPIRSIHKLNVSRLTVTVRRGRVSVIGTRVAATTTVAAAAAPGRRTSMADDNRGVSVVSPPPPSPPPPPPPPPSSLPSPPLLATVVALRARHAVVSGAHRVHMYATYLSPFSEINKQCRGHSSRAPAGKIVPCLVLLLPRF